MIVWVVVLAVLAVLSYLSDVGVLTFLQNLRIPFLNASIMSILLLLCAAAMLIRVLLKMKQKEKELLGTKITALEKELQAFKEKVG
jgi:membrane protein implicated in regulation of membrane protease activity